MRSRFPGVLLALTMTVAVGSCGGDGETPEAARLPSVTGAETGADADAAAVRITTQRWIVEDACADDRDTRVRLFDFTDGGQFPARGYWRLENGGTINRVIECHTKHEICLGAVQDRPPGLQWGVGIRGNRYPCRFPNRCCFSCTTLAHKLTLSCQARTSTNFAESEGEILAEDEGSFE
ncbi:MAG TPA: hypothetical protein VFM88_05620 [Vicinamibacteria bacterium]|nr:hypothetical protein [Vicinamibacteria bacterium]